jgi:hypothetical protein
MKISTDNIGNFKSMKQAEAYKRAMEVKQNVSSVADELKTVDDIEGIDFNYAASGSVKVLNMERNYDTGLHSETTGELEYDYASGDLKSLKAEQYMNMSNLSGWQGLAGCFVAGKFKYKMESEKTLFGKENDVYIEKSGMKTKKVTIDKKTGDIDYKEFNMGIPTFF